MAGAAVVTGAPPPPRWAPRALGTARRADPRLASRGTVDVASRRVAFPSAAPVDARRARRDHDARVAARSTDSGASSRDSPMPTSDADVCVFERGDVTLLPNGARMRFVSKPDVQFLYDEIFVDECYAKHGLEIREGATVIDVGGNIGMFALYAARKAGDAGRVYALEPIPKTFAALRENVTKNVVFFSSSSRTKSGEGGDRVVHCLDAKDAKEALRTNAKEEGSLKESSRKTKSSPPNVVIYNVGVSDGAKNTATFTFYPRAAGWSSLAPDEKETTDNVRRFAMRRLSMRADIDGDEVFEDEKVFGDKDTTKRKNGSHNDASKDATTSAAALHPLASLGAKLLAFADGGGGDSISDDDDASGRKRKTKRNGVFDVLRRGVFDVLRYIARLVFSIAVSLVTNYLLGGKIQSECPLVTVSDVIRANGLCVGGSNTRHGFSEDSESQTDDSRTESSSGDENSSSHYAVDFLKIDVERCELLALRGIEKEHRGSIRQIAMEVHDDERNGLRAVMDLLTAPVGSGGFGFDAKNVVATQPDELVGGTLWNVYARR